MSRLGWQHLRALSATARHDSRKDHFSQLSANLPTVFHPLDSGIDRKEYEDSDCGPSKSSLSLQLASALDHGQLTTIDRLLCIEGPFLLIINDTVNGNLSPITLFISRAQGDILAFLYTSWISPHIVIGQNPRQQVAESRSFASQPVVRRHQVFSRWLGTVPALLQLSYSRLQGVLAARDSGVNERNGTEQTTTSSRTKAGRVEKTPSRRTKKSKKVSSAPRPRKPPSGNESDSSLDRETQESKAKPRKAKSKGPRYACPYLKRDPFHHLKCLCQHQESSRRVKQHLARNHLQPIHCPICYQDFETRRDCDEHVIAGGCIQGAHAPPEGMTQDQQTQLDQITATSEDGKWFAMWSVLFPDTDPPSSPYADADDLGGFMAGEVHRLWRPLYRALLRPFMDDDQFERYHNLLMRTSSSYLSTFSSSLAGRGPIPYADGQPSSLNPSLEHWVQNIPEELPNNTGRGFSPVMSPSAFLPATPQAGSYTLPDDDASLDASSSHTIDSTGNLSIPQGMPDDPENTVDGLMRPEEAPHLMSAFTAGQFPVHNNQYTNTLPPVNRYQESNPNPSTSGFGFGPTNSPLHAGYVYGPQIYDPGVFQNSSLSNFYGTRSPQQLQTAAIVDQLMSQYGDGNYTPHITSPGMIGFSQVARHQSGGHAPEPVGDDVSVPQRRRQHNQFERTGPRHC